MEWTTTKPTRSRVKCEYEYAEGERYIGVTHVGKGGLLFRGTRAGDHCGIHNIELPVADAKGRWYILPDIPDPPQRMTPGDYVAERMVKLGWCAVAMRDKRFNEAVTAAIAAARRGELLIEE